MDWYTWISSGTAPVFGVKINGWYKLGLEHTFEVHQKYIRYIFKREREEWDNFPPFLSAIFKPTRRKLNHSPDPARLVSDSGTKAAPLLGSGNRGYAILSVSFRNVSALRSKLSLQFHLFRSHFLT